MAELDPIPLPAFHKDLFAPVLLASTPVTISEEQERLVKEVLLVSSSDSNFAQKAANALRIILLGGVNSGILPNIASLVPNQKGMGSATFLIRVIGTGFDPTCTVHVNGNPITTTFVSDTEVRCSISLASVSAPTTYPVVVRTGAGALSNSVIFTVTAA